MKHVTKERSDARRGSRGVMAAAALAAVLAVMPAQAQIPQIEFGACGPMDVVFVIDTTGSMQGAIDNIKADIATPGTGIIDTIVNAAGENFLDTEEARLGVVVVNGSAEPTFDGQQYDCFIYPGDPNLGDTVSFDPNEQYPFGIVGDCIIALRDLGSDITLVENSILNLPAANDGGFTPEITAEALRTVLQGLPQTPDMGGVTPNVTPPGALNLPNGWPRLQWNDWDGAFRPTAKKVIFLITDNVPGGTDSRYNFLGTEDSDMAAAMATAAAAAEVIIQPILVALSDGSYEPNAEIIMQNYASATGGQLTKVPFSGEGTALAIISIIENCGGDPEEKPGRMTGGGSIFHENNRRNPRVTHGFTLHCDGEPNRLQVNWPKNKFHLEMLTEASCYDDPELDEQNPVAGFDTMIGSGVGRLNGVSGATVEFTFIDDGEPGKVSDTAKMIIKNSGGTVVLDVLGRLQNGNHQAHTEN